ncbi:hypothetical protein HW115_07285 [Verrucomicrobiaceae bacterium N1E253]|uniref:Uncharacterized protein n=1 Tax=Oceaniferula marina TaxID=2748318 RepID=A0A851GE26_9BACT|nr:hypothetical protein [Oceaniferula marina]NWK55409.1 hypothetical protein [Oceaniferula marina]
MNLNTIKRGFTKTNPERGLHSLPGARRSELRHETPETIRIRGKYISDSHDSTGRVIGILAFFISCICTLILILLCSHWLPFVTPLVHFDTLLAMYVVLGFILHLMVIIADTMRNSNAPWARKSIIVFWSGIGVLLAISIPILILIEIV